MSRGIRYTDEFKQEAVNQVASDLPPSTISLTHY